MHTDLVTADSARVRLARIGGDALLGGELGQGLQLRIGPSIRYADAQRDSTTLAGQPLVLAADAFEPQVHAGGAARLAFDLSDSPINPRQGFRLKLMPLPTPG